MPGEPWTGEISRENPGTMTSTKTPWQLCLDALNQSLQQALPTGEQIKLVTTLRNLSLSQVRPHLSGLGMLLAIPRLYGRAPGIWSIGYEVHQQVILNQKNPQNLWYFQAIGNARKVLGGGRTDPWTSYAAVFLGRHKPHLLAQLHAHRGLHISIIYLIYLFYNFPSVPRSLTLSLQSPSGKWS